MVLTTPGLIENKVFVYVEFIARRRFVKASCSRFPVTRFLKRF